MDYYMQNNMFWLLLWPSFLLSFGAFIYLVCLGIKDVNSKGNMCLTLGEVDEDGNHSTFHNGQETDIKVKL